jgi:hypothetical protein
MEQSEEEAVYAHQEALKYVPVDKTSQWMQERKNSQNSRWIIEEMVRTL